MLEFFVALCYRCKMGKFSCCVPGCTNNWRNSPEKKFHTLPSDAKVRRLYEKLIRNENLKLNAQHIRICGDHFPDGERMCRTQLPSIFPWTAIPEKRRVIEKHEVPSTTKKTGKGFEACELRSEDVFAEESKTMSVTMRFLYLKILILWSV